MLKGHLYIIATFMYFCVFITMRLLQRGVFLLSYSLHHTAKQRSKKLTYVYFTYVYFTNLHLSVMNKIAVLALTWEIETYNTPLHLAANGLDWK